MEASARCRALLPRSVRPLAAPLLACALALAPLVWSRADVSGTVLDPAGKPASSVAVTWIERSASGDAAVGPSVRTDAAGAFRFTRSLPSPEKAFVSLAAVPDGGGLGFAWPGRTPGSPLTIRLHAPTSLRVAFTDEAGKPAAGVRVRVASLSAGPGEIYLDVPAGLVPGWEQTTDAGGACTVAGLPQGLGVRLVVLDERYAHLSYRDNITLAATALQPDAAIRLRPGCSIEGTVTFDATKGPAADVRVAAQGAGGQEGWAQATTGADGRYRLTQLSAGMYNVALDLRGGLDADWTAAARETVSVRAGETLAKQDFALIHGVLVSGKVTDSLTGKPIADVMIGVYGPAHPQSSAWVQSALTGADGVYRFRVPPGDQYIYAMGAKDGRYAPPKSGARVKVAGTAARGPDFALEPSLAVQAKPVRVRVVGPDGKPAPHATVALQPVSSEPYGDSRWSTKETDAGGACKLPMTTASVRLRARLGELATPETALALSGGTVVLAIKPHVLAVISGEVADAKGLPISGASILLCEWWLDTGTSVASTQTGADGRYVFRDVWPGPLYSVSAEARGFGSDYADRRAVRPGDTVTLPAITLPRADGFVAGRLVDENGKPVAHQMVQISGRHQQPQQTYTDADGRFRFDGVVNEAVRFYSEGVFDDTRRTVHAGDTDVVLVKRPRRADPMAALEDAASKRRNALVGHAAPPVQAAAWLNATAKMPAALKGKIVLVDFWSVGCGPCVASLPAVERVSHQFAGRGVVVMGLCDGFIKKSELAAFARKHGLTYPLAIDRADPKRRSFGLTMKSFGVTGIPTVGVIDRKGVVRYLAMGLDGAVGTIGDLLAREGK